MKRNNIILTLLQSLHMATPRGDLSTITPHYLCLHQHKTNMCDSLQNLVMLTYCSKIIPPQATLEVILHAPQH